MTSFCIRVLVLEDHHFQRAVAVSLLRKLGCHEVFEAADGVQALEVLQQVGGVDIALCDLCMEGMDGLEFLQQVGHSGLVGSVIISSSMSADLRRTVQQIVSLLGLEMLGDLGKPLQAHTLENLLKKRASGSVVAPPKTAPVRQASDEEVRWALNEHQLQAWYQPKVDMHTDDVCGVEVLSRWVHPLRGILSPAEFMPVLERCGLLNRLLFMQMNQALSLQRLAKNTGLKLDLSFNLHASQLTNSNLTAVIKGILSLHEASPASLTFELTESGLLEAPATSLETLVRLRMMGCLLSIDDFGAGYSSLQRLCQLPFNEIKLDGEFIRTLLSEPRCQAIVSSTLALGKTLGMSVVVEGIETEKQREALLAMGCTQGQGYLFARPMNDVDLLRWLPGASKI